MSCCQTRNSSNLVSSKSFVYSYRRRRHYRPPRPRQRWKAAEAEWLCMCVLHTHILTRFLRLLLPSSSSRSTRKRKRLQINITQCAKCHGLLYYQSRPNSSFPDQNCSGRVGEANAADAILHRGWQRWLRSKRRSLFLYVVRARPFWQNPHPHTRTSRTRSPYIEEESPRTTEDVLDIRRWMVIHRT